VGESNFRNAGWKKLRNFPEWKAEFKRRSKAGKEIGKMRN